MAHIIQVRDVPDDVHQALRAAAAASGLSLNVFVRRELARLASRAGDVRHNRDVIRATQEQLGTTVDDEEIRRAVLEGRDR